MVELFCIGFSATVLWWLGRIFRRRRDQSREPSGLALLLWPLLWVAGSIFLGMLLFVVWATLAFAFRPHS